MNNTTSRFFNIQNGWSMIEYEYNSTIYPLSEISFVRVDNKFPQNQKTFISYHPQDFNKVKRITNNTLDTGVQALDETGLNWLRFDLDHPLRFFEQVNPNMNFDSIFHLTTNYPELNSVYVEYDTIRIHILRGYNFEDRPGFITRAYYEDINNKKKIFITQNSYLKDDTLQYHTKNLRFGDQLFDRYYEIKIPKLKSIIAINQITGDMPNLPSVDKSLLKLFINDVSDVQTDEKGQMIVKTHDLDDSNDKRVIPIELENYAEEISAIIRESRNGDYFEFFPTYQGGFIADYITQNTSYVNAIVFHDITIYEHTFSLGEYNETATQTLTFIQEDSFDAPYTFRPVITNPNTIAFTIEYFMRIVQDSTNSDDIPSQIIRKATLTYKEAQKYGRYLTRLNINSTEPIKIVNKIITENSAQNTSKNTSLNYSGVNDQTFETFNILKSEFIFPINKNLVSASYKEIEIDNSNNIVNNKSILTSTVYGQSLLNIQLYPFDNYFSFKLYKANRDNDLTVTPMTLYLDDNNYKYYIVFYDSNSNLIKIEHENPFSTQVYKLEPGELMFNITPDDVSNIMEGSFYIVVENLLTKSYNGKELATLQNFENVLYQGNITKAK